MACPAKASQDLSWRRGGRDEQPPAGAAGLAGQPGQERCAGAGRAGRPAPARAGGTLLRHAAWSMWCFWHVQRAWLGLFTALPAGRVLPRQIAALLCLLLEQPCRPSAGHEAGDGAASALLSCRVPACLLWRQAKAAWGSLPCGLRTAVATQPFRRRHPCHTMLPGRSCATCAGARSNLSTWPAA